MANTTVAQATSGGAHAPAQDARIRRAMRNDKIATRVLGAIVAIVMAIVVAMVVYILFQGVGQLFQPGFLTEASRSNGTEGGIAYQLFDSFYLLILTLIISLPISLFGAVFLVEYAPEGPVTKIASTAIETLSSLPSIVVGMFGFLMFSVNFGWGYSLISGAIALTMFNIPILTRVITQALEDVPASQRDACLAMGLTRWETTLHVLIPRAMPAIVTGVVLSAGRVFGEAGGAALHLWHVEPGAPELPVAQLLEPHVRLEHLPSRRVARRAHLQDLRRGQPRGAAHRLGHRPRF